MQVPGNHEPLLQQTLAEIHSDIPKHAEEQQKLRLTFSSHQSAPDPTLRKMLRQIKVHLCASRSHRLHLICQIGSQQRNGLATRPVRSYIQQLSRKRLKPLRLSRVFCVRTHVRISTHRRDNRDIFSPTFIILRPHAEVASFTSQQFVPYYL